MPNAPDLSDAYANSTHIPDGDSYYGRWADAAAMFRAAHPLAEIAVPYGIEQRQTYDLFHPQRMGKGTVVFVHGGYWMAASPQDFSHLAAGAVAAGYACAMPSYRLAPDVRIADITDDIAAAIGAIARRTVGPLYLVGHSAGGHLVGRMACADIMADWQVRVRHVMAISPLSDLAPLMQTAMNDNLRIDPPEARSESLLSYPRHDIAVTAWVGAAERPAFLDQSRGLHDHWGCDLVIDPDRHHFDVIEGLIDPHSEMMKQLLI